jgi:predicted SprT family Zn-dependent metalloprotease
MDEKTLHDLFKQLCEKHKVVGWKLAFYNKKRAIAQAWFGPKIVYISKYFFEHNTDEEIDDTIKHEIAHILAGAKNRHNSRWQQWCEIVGCRPKAFQSTPIDMPYKYFYQCPNCKKMFKTFRPITSKSSCGVCCKSSFNKEYELQKVEGK